MASQHLNISCQTLMFNSDPIHHCMHYSSNWRHMKLRWRHNGRDSVSNHQPNDCLLKRLFRRRSKKTSKLRVTGLCVGNSPGTGEFPAQMASNAENVSIWWRHHEERSVGFWWSIKIPTESTELHIFPVPVVLRCAHTLHWHPRFILMPTLAAPGIVQCCLPVTKKLASRQHSGCNEWGEVIGWSSGYRLYYIVSVILTVSFDKYRYLITI